MIAVRRIEARDVEAVVGLVHDLAAYERAPAECTLSVAQLEAALFSEGAALFGHVAVSADDQAPGGGAAGGEVVGCALWFLNFSTWRGTHGIYLEDLYVRPEFRRQGAGRALLAELAAECGRRGYARLEWAVLDWNAPAIDFYRTLGAVGLDEWTTFRLTDEPLARLGREAR